MAINPTLKYTFYVFYVQTRLYISKKFFISKYFQELESEYFDKTTKGQKLVLRILKKFIDFRLNYFKLSQGNNNIIVFSPDDGVVIYENMMVNVYQDYDLMYYLELMKINPFLTEIVGIVLKKLFLLDLHENNCNAFLIIGAIIRLIIYYDSDDIEVTAQIFMKEYHTYERTNSLLPEKI